MNRCLQSRRSFPSEGTDVSVMPYLFLWLISNSAAHFTRLQCEAPRVHRDVNSVCLWALQFDQDGRSPDISALNNAGVETVIACTQCQALVVRVHFLQLQQYIACVCQ